MSNAMRDAIKSPTRQSGVVLVTGLLFLLVVTIIAVTAASNSSLGLKMSASLQDSYRSFQSAEAGIDAALGLGYLFKTKNDTVEPFKFVDVASHPFRNQAADPNTVPIDVKVFYERTVPCPSENNKGGSSTDKITCSYFRITSEHVEPGRARTKIELGVVREIPD